MNSCEAEEENVGVPSLFFFLFCVFSFFSLTMTKSLDQSLLLGSVVGFNVRQPNVKINDRLSNVKLTVRQIEGTVSRR